MRLRLDSPGDGLLCAEPGPAGLKKLTLLAYTGGAMQPPGFVQPVVVDLRSARPHASKIPILYTHDPDRIVGHTTEVTVGTGGVSARGVASGYGADARRVIDLAGGGHPWQASLGAVTGRMDHVPAGQSVQLNGRTFPGPVSVARDVTIREISVVPMGADNLTRVDITARRATPPPVPEVPVPYSLAALMRPVVNPPRPSASRTAVHEAGHAVVAVCVGQPYTSIELAGHGDGAFHHSGGAHETDPDWIVRHAATTAGGVMAEHLAFGDLADGWTAGANEWGGDLSVLRSLSRLRSRHAPDRPFDPFGDARRHLEDPLYMSAVGKVAAALDRERRLTSERVHALCVAAFRGW